MSFYLTRLAPIIMDPEGLTASLRTLQSNHQWPRSFFRSMVFKLLGNVATHDFRFILGRAVSLATFERRPAVRWIGVCRTASWGLLGFFSESVGSKRRWWRSAHR
jgi:hypothetical protein